MVNTYNKRSAFSLIELIFAIVIIAISVASVPIMTNAIGKNVENNLVQETIFAASAQMNQILSYRWDEHSIDESMDVNATGLAQVIDRAGADACNADKIKPNGHILQPLHRRCLDNNLTRVSATMGSDAGDTVADDIDDFNGDNGNLFTGSFSGDAYKNNYVYQVDVNISDMNGNVAVNDEAKEVVIKVFLTDDAGNVTEQISQLNAYTFNIGEVDYYKRMYP